MTTFPKYPKYKDSGVEWLGEVPQHWEVSRSRRVFKQRTELARRDDQQLSATQAYGVIPQAEYEERIGRKVTKISMHLEKRKHVELDDFVISMRSFQGGLERAWAQGCIRSSYTVLEPAIKVAPSYFAYLFKSPQYIGALQATGNFIRDGQDLTFQNYILVDLPLPPLAEQTRIGAFLDEKTTEIDTLIAKKQRQIDLLDEQKAILINRAVTRGVPSEASAKAGLHPNPELLDSGIEWIGPIPKGWEVKSTKHVCERIIDCKNRTAEVVTQGGYYVLRTSNVKKGELVRDEITRTNLKNFTIWTERGAPQEGDVLFTREAPAGEACVFDGSLPACLGQRMMYFRPDAAQLLPQFLVHTIYHGPSATYIQLKTNGSTVGHLRLPDVYALPVLLPPVEEQKRILESLATTEEAQKKLIQTVQSQIQTLQTLRSTLIAHAVTGKIRV